MSARSSRFPVVISLALLALTGLLMALTPPEFFSWSSMSGNGSRVELKGANEAVFVIRRTNAGPKSDPGTHGYAYLQSPPVNLPAGWRMIRISGEWWREPTQKSNYPELALRVHARYPLFVHGDERYGQRDGNFIHIGLRSWKPGAYFLERGAGGAASRSGAIGEPFPDKPRGFMLVIIRRNNGRIGWSYFEHEQGQDWRKVFSTADSRLFDGTSARRVFIRIGGWNTWEYPVTNRLHVRDLEIEVSTWQENDMPGNFELNVLSDLEDQARREQGLLAREQHTKSGGGSEQRKQPYGQEAKKAERMERLGHCETPPYVLNASNNRYYGGLQEALDAARPGAVIKLGCGVYHGHFHIRKQVTLESADGRSSAILDGDGSGIVLRVDGARSRVRKLEVRNSGIDDTVLLFWRGSGILVTAPEVRLDALLVTDNGNGITARGAAGLRITNSEIRGNRHDGISLQGVRNALVRNVRVQDSGGGISVSSLIVLPHDRLPRNSSKLARILRESTPSSRVIITRNRITGNGEYGIGLWWYSNNCSIRGNTIDNTGMRVKPSYRPYERYIEFYGRLVPRGGVPMGDVMAQGMINVTRNAGTGIRLSSLAHDNEITKNVIMSNAGHGVVLDLAGKNRVKNNLISNNDRAGVLIISESRFNRIVGNRIHSNRDHGAAIGDYARQRVEPWPTRNVIARNDIQNNGKGDAFDASTTTYSPQEIVAVLRKDKVYRAIAGKVLKYPLLLRTYQDYFKPGENRWEDGRFGNHYGDFDEASEGFRDENGDGVGDGPYHIPGGRAVDSHPLSMARGQEVTASVPQPPASLAR